MKEYKHRFRITRPHNRDAHVLICVRDVMVNGMYSHSEFLSLTGWDLVKQGQAIDDYRLPSITGIEAMHQDAALAVLDHYEQHIRKYIEKAET